jgi:RsiW-degrading membrane proteinase PrsW (M82 family)
MTKKKIPAGLESRVAVSIIVVFGWLIYAIIHVVFFWDNFNTAQNIALIIITFLIGAAILGAMWVIWGIKMGRLDSEQNDKEDT